MSKDGKVHMPIAGSKREDARDELFRDIRMARPRLYDADAWGAWYDAIGQVILSYPDIHDRWKCVEAVSADLRFAEPCLTPSQAQLIIAQAVMEATVRYGKV